MSTAPSDSLTGVLYSLRSVRRFKPDPVPLPLLREAVRAATYAPSSTNRQRWRFLILLDRSVRSAIGRIYADAFFKDRDRGPLSIYLVDPEVGHTYREAAYLAEHFGEVPAMVLAAHSFQDSPGASIYPACQNLMLRAASLGLGSVLTTVWLRREGELRRLLGIPEEYRLAALIALGWPARAYGPPRRRPVEEVAYLDHWGAPLPEDLTAGRP